MSRLGRPGDQLHHGLRGFYRNNSFMYQNVLDLLFSYVTFMGVAGRRAVADYRRSLSCWTAIFAISLVLCVASP